jgi:molybdopterin molybdotransferase
VVAARFFVETAIRKMTGRETEQPLNAKLTNDVSSKEGFQFFLKTKVGISEDGTMQADVLQGQQSFMVKAFLTANAWAIAPREATKLTTGDMVKVYPLSSQGWSL